MASLSHHLLDIFSRRCEDVHVIHPSEQTHAVISDVETKVFSIPTIHKRLRKSANNRNKKAKVKQDLLAAGP